MRSMQIHSIQVTVLSVPLDTREIKNTEIAKGSQPHKEAILCRVRTECGVLGECYMTVLGASGREIGRLAAEVFAPLLCGHDASRPVACWTAMYRYVQSSFWDRALALRAMACIDGALWDAVGRYAQLPLHRIWGGAKDRLPIVLMDSRWHPDEPVESFVERISALQEQELAGCKIKVGIHSPAGPLADARRLCKVREAVHSSFKLFADSNQGWSLDEALRFARAAQEASLEWLEEPCRWPDDRNSMVQVRAAGLLSICAGQMESTDTSCRDLIAAAAIDVCNVDASFCGVSVWRRVAELAASFSVDMVHHMEPQLGAALAGSLAHGRHVEAYDEPADPFWYRMVTNRPLPVAGEIVLSDLPGWGWTLDEDFIRHYRAE